MACIGQGRRGSGSFKENWNSHSYFKDAQNRPWTQPPLPNVPFPGNKIILTTFHEKKTSRTADALFIVKWTIIKLLRKANIFTPFNVNTMVAFCRRLSFWGILTKVCTYIIIFKFHLKKKWRLGASFLSVLYMYMNLNNYETFYYWLILCD